MIEIEYRATHNPPDELQDLLCFIQGPASRVSCYQYTDSSTRQAVHQVEDSANLHVAGKNICIRAVTLQGALFSHY